MKLYFGGAEVPGWRKILANARVPNVSMSFVGLSRRVKHLDGWDVAEKFALIREESGDLFRQNVFLDSGAYSLNKPDAGYTDDEALELAARYMAFVAANIKSIDMVSEFDALQLGRDWREGVREDFWADVPPEKFLPIWHAEDGPEELERLTRLYRRVGVLQADTDVNITPLLNAATGLSGALLHGVAMTRMEAMRSVRWDSVGSTSWLSPSQYGDTFVWTGKELKRYPKAYKDNARRRHRTLFESHGFDPAKIAVDDTTEVLKLSIWSWTNFVVNIDRDGGVTTPPDSGADGNLEIGVPEVGTEIPGTRNEELVHEPRERVLLPVLSVTETAIKDGDKDGETERRIGMRDSNLMQCSTCYLKGKCPQFRPGSDCAFDIPMTVTTTTQVRALRKAILAMQGQRVAMMRMIEQVEGGYADPNTSSEIRALWKMIMDDATADKEGFSFEIKATGSGNSGMISRIFGGDTADKVNALEAPRPARDVLEDFGIVDAEVVEELPARREP